MYIVYMHVLKSLVLNFDGYIGSDAVISTVHQKVIILYDNFRL